MEKLILGGFPLKKKKKTSLSSDDSNQTLDSFEKVVQLFLDKREILIASNLKSFVSLVSFEPLRIEINILDQSAKTLPGDMMKLLQEWTDEKWVVTTSNKQGAPTLAEQERQAYADLLTQVNAHPDIQHILKTLPGAYVESVGPEN